MYRDMQALADQLQEIGPQLTATERDMIYTALEATADLPAAAKEASRAAVAQLAISLGRRRRKSAANRLSDRAGRVLVGVRVPRELAEIYAAKAQAQGVSLYQWVCAALHAHADRA